MKHKLLNNLTKIIILVIVLCFSAGLMAEPAKGINSDYSISLVSPNGGEVYSYGEQIEITWKQKGINQITIGYKTCDSCLDWIKFSMAVDPTKEEMAYSWQPPQPLTGKNNIKIYLLGYTGYGSISDVSDSSFTILGEPEQEQEETSEETSPEEEQVNEEQEVIEEEKETPTTKTSTPDVQLFIMAYCPYCAQMLRGIIPVVNLLEDNIEFEVMLIGAIHGEEEIEEQINQICLKSIYPEKHLDYLECFIESKDRETCFDENGIDNSVIEPCVIKEINSGSKGISESKYKIAASPTLIVNGKIIDAGKRDSQSLLNDICGFFDVKPAECSKKLSTQQPSGGFGTGMKEETEEEETEETEDNVDEEEENNQLICVKPVCDENPDLIYNTGKVDSYGCPIFACGSGGFISEKITCKFEGTEKEQQCYFAGQGGPEDEGTKFCKADAGSGSCVITYSGYKGEQITWKSSCGQYQYTIQDGNDEVIYFKCNEGETTTTEIKNKGFRSAYYQCYDGAEETHGDETSCKSSETWQEYAKKFCENHCYSDKSKCGVNSFSVNGECYLEESTPDHSTNSGDGSEGTSTEINPQGTPETAPTIPKEATVCKDSCPSDGKCYPFGYRKSSEYCSDGGNFIPQLEASTACDNSFECTSNVCVDGECISGGLIKQIIEWLKGLFG